MDDWKAKLREAMAVPGNKGLLVAVEISQELMKKAMAGEKMVIGGKTVVKDCEWMKDPIWGEVLARWQTALENVDETIEELKQYA